MAEPRERLDSWKEIAAHLRRDVSTVIRWERERGLPVHRVPGRRHSRVFAYTEELDQWLAAAAARRGAATPEAESPAPPPVATASRHSPARLASGAVGLVLVVAAMAWSLARVSAPPARMLVAGGALVAMDDVGRPLWKHQFQPEHANHAANLASIVSDLDDDGRHDVLAAVDVGRPQRSEYAGELLRFSGDGRVAWRAAIEDRLVFRDAEYGPPWVSGDLRVHRIGGEARISWAVHHFTWWPGLLATFDARGERIGTFVNAGWIRMSQASADGRYLLVSGVSNSRRSYFLAVLDGARPSGRSPEPPGTPTQCLDCPAGDPLQYFVFPRSDVGRQHPFPTDGPTLVVGEDGLVQVHALESHGPSIAAAIYEFRSGNGADGPFAPNEARFSDSYWEWHRLLEQEGRLDHPAASCPERQGLTLERWTPTLEWQPVRIPSR